MLRSESHEILRRLDLNLFVLFDAVLRFANMRKANARLGAGGSAPAVPA